jgi:IS605 OrfB family transposase
VLYQIRNPTSLALVKLARKIEVGVIVFEELGDYRPPKGKEEAERTAQQAFFRALYKLVEYKAKRFGVTVENVKSFLGS